MKSPPTATLRFRGVSLYSRKYPALEDVPMETDKAFTLTEIELIIEFGNLYGEYVYMELTQARDKEITDRLRAIRTALNMNQFDILKTSAKLRKISANITMHGHND